MQKWEYKIVGNGAKLNNEGKLISPKKVEELLNELGGQGWKVIDSHCDDDLFVAIMEREKKE